MLRKSIIKLVFLSIFVGFVLVIFRLTLFGIEVSSLYFHVVMKSSTDDIAKVYYDFGHGLSEKDSTAVQVFGDQRFHDYQFIIPHGTLRTLRFDPLTVPGRVIIKSMELVNGFGKREGIVDLRQLRPSNQIKTLVVHDHQATMITEEQANDPQIFVTLNPPALSGYLSWSFIFFVLRMLLEFLVYSCFSLCIYFACSWLYSSGWMLRFKQKHFTPNIQEARHIWPDQHVIRYLSISGLSVFAFVGATVVIISIQLFLHPIVGIANNSDFSRISTQVGLYPIEDLSSRFKYVNLTYTFGPSQNVKYLSSELIFAKLASIMNRTFLSKEHFDIRYLGLVHVIAYAVALFLFSYNIKLSPLYKFFFLTCCIFILIDVRITSYFNSFYSESASVIFFLFTLAVMLKMGSIGVSYLQDVLCYIAFFVFSFLLAFSKSQHLIMLIPFWGFCVLCAKQRLKSSAARWIWTLGTAFLMLGGVWWGIMSNAYAYAKGENIRIVLNDEIKPHSPDFSRDLRELEATESDWRSITLEKIAFFYVKHPKRYLELLERRAKKAFSHLPFGNHIEAESRGPWDQSTKFNIWWSFKDKNYPKRLDFIMGVLIGGFLIGVWYYFKGRMYRYSHMGLITATLSIMAVCAFLIASTFEANGPEKHLFLFNVLFDLVTVFGIFLCFLSFQQRGYLKIFHQFLPKIEKISKISNFQGIQ